MIENIWMTLIAWLTFFITLYARAILTSSCRIDVYIQNIYVGMQVTNIRDHQILLYLNLFIASIWHQICEMQHHYVDTPLIYKYVDKRLKYLAYKLIILTWKIFKIICEIIMFAHQHRRKLRYVDKQLFFMLNNMQHTW